jgi:LysM repeat protein
MTEKNKKWNAEALDTLNSMTANESVVSAVTIEAVAAKLTFTARSVASKLRQLGREVASLAKDKVPTFTEQEGADLASYVTQNAGALTYKQIAENFAGGKFTDKQVQGKLLALELTGNVKAAEKVEVARTYTPAEEAKFIELANAGKFIEDIADALGKPIASVRGKALSLTRSEQIAGIPAQKTSHAANQADPVDELGDKIATMTVAEIATAIGKTERGTKTLLTRRGIKVANYDGKAKQEKAEGKRTAA